MNDAGVDALLVLITAPPAEAERIAGSLVEARLAACVNVLPGVRSIYRWQGRVERDEEALLLVKTTPAALERLARHVAAVHPYENPEVVATPLVGGRHEYLAWLAENVEAPER